MKECEICGEYVENGKLVDCITIQNTDINNPTGDEIPVPMEDGSWKFLRLTYLEDNPDMNILDLVEKYGVDV